MIGVFIRVRVGKEVGVGVEMEMYRRGGGCDSDIEENRDKKFTKFILHEDFYFRCECKDQFPRR